MPPFVSGSSPITAILVPRTLQKRVRYSNKATLDSVSPWISYLPWSVRSRRASLENTWSGSWFSTSSVLKAKSKQQLPSMPNTLRAQGLRSLYAWQTGAPQGLGSTISRLSMTINSSTNLMANLACTSLTFLVPPASHRLFAAPLLPRLLEEFHGWFLIPNPALRTQS